MATEKQHSLVRTIYLYIFALLGLVLLIIGGVGFINMGLKAFVFTKAEEEQRLAYGQPPMPYSIEKVEGLQNEEGLSSEEKQLIQNWLADYQAWQDSVSKVNYLESRRQRDASLNLALMAVGLPLYLYHWGIISRETKG